MAMGIRGETTVKKRVEIMLGKLLHKWWIGANKRNESQLTGLVLLPPPCFFVNFTFARVKTHKIGCAAKHIDPVVHLLVS